MFGKNISIPVGMVFKIHYCSQCGAKLKKERTHRVVSKDDVDYYQYHEYGNFPRYDHDVYNYRFKCPCCGKRISYEEQCIIKRIQRKCGSKVLSSATIKEHYEECKKNNNKRYLTSNILSSIIINLIICCFLFFFYNYKSTEEIIFILVIFCIITAISITSIVKGYKGSQKLKRNKSYSYEHEALMNKLHAYASNNRELILISERCYCFCCKETFGSKKIQQYDKDGKTAICPKCGNKTLLPEAIDYKINRKVINDMNNYWF